jgi:hypothetical protein
MQYPEYFQKALFPFEQTDENLRQKLLDQNSYFIHFLYTIIYGIYLMQPMGCGYEKSE